MFKSNHKISRRMFFDTMLVLFIAELTGAITCAIDGLITSRYLGRDAISAFGYSSSYFQSVSIITGILLVGCQTLCVESITKGKKENASKIASLCSIFGVGIAILITALFCIFPNQIGIIFGANTEDAASFKLIAPYLRGVSLGAPFWLFGVVLTPIVQLDGGGKRVKLAAFLSAVTDILLDLILGVKLKMGVFGMGLATSISHVVNALIVGSFFLTKKCTIKLSFKGLNLKELRPVIKNGIPRAISMISRTVGPILLNIIVVSIDKYNSSGMAALSVQRSINLLATSVGWGICGAVLMLETLYYNEKNLDEMKNTIKYALVSIVIGCGLITLLLYFGRVFIVKLFLQNWESNINLYYLAIKSIKYYAFSIPFIALNVSFASYIQSIGKLKLANVINFLVECFSLVTACYVLSITDEYDGFFKGFFIGEIVLTGFIVLYIALYGLINKRNKYAIYLLKPDFVSPDTKVIESSINTQDDVMNLSRGIEPFLENSFLTDSQKYKISLAIEEMGMNIFSHAIKKDNKKHHLAEIRVVITSDKAVITLTDNCKKFDITKKLKDWSLDKEHPEKNIGIRTIMLIAKEVNYNNTMNINNLQLII